MQKVYKYSFKVDDIISLPIPIDARILTVNMQGSNPCIWALVDPNDVVYKNRKFLLYGTGHAIERNDLSYIGTFQMFNGDLIFHLFEIPYNAYE